MLDGTDDFINTGIDTDISTWTISCWTKSSSAPDDSDDSGPIQRDENYQINWNHTNASLRGAAAVKVGSTWYGASFGTLNADTWYHLTATYDGETLLAYKDGVLITTNTDPSGDPDTSADELYLGKNPATTFVVIEEVPTDNWGIGGESVTTRRKKSQPG